MKKLSFVRLICIGAMGALLFSCQSKNTPSAKRVTPCNGPDCPAPPQAPSQDKVPCREGECDEMEGGEEAGIHVIEISQPEEESAAVVPAPTENQETAKSTDETKSEDVKFEEPTTQIFEDLPHNPVSENTVVLSLKE